MKYSKSFLSYEAQAELLVQRGMIVPDMEHLMKCLQYIGYFRLSAYWFPFKNEYDDNFKTGTSFSDIYCRYRFDRRFKTLIFDAIERVETAIKARIVYEFTNVMAHLVI